MRKPFREYETFQRVPQYVLTMDIGHKHFAGCSLKCPVRSWLHLIL